MKAIELIAKDQLQRLAKIFYVLEQEDCLDFDDACLFSEGLDLISKSLQKIKSNHMELQ